MSRAEIETLAELILADYGSSRNDRSKPVDVEHLAEVYLGLEMDYQRLSENGSVLGMMVFGDSLVPVYDEESAEARRIWAREGTIIIDNSLLTGRRIRRGRFTVGHEVAHWLLHRPYFVAQAGQAGQVPVPGAGGQSFVRCRFGAVETKRRRLVSDDDWLEWQADSLASALLMPRRAMARLVRERFGSVGIDSGCYSRGSDDGLDLWLDYLLWELADLFEVSFTAAQIRLENLSFIKEKKEEVGLFHAEYAVW